jgi:TPR repeat protein
MALLGLAFFRCGAPSESPEGEAVSSPAGPEVPPGCSGSPEGCLAAAESSLELGKPDLAERQLEYACERNLPAACRRLAWAHGTSELGDRDLIEAMDVLQPACLRDDLDACLMIGRLLGRPPAVDSPRAMMALKKACEGELPPACDLAGNVSLDELGEPRMARDFWTRGCELRAARSCLSLGLMLSTAEHGEPDLAAAHRLLIRACELDSSTCHALEAVDSTGLQRPK